MTELERKALLGDPEAQKQCTELGIILPCPFCGSKPHIIGRYCISYVTCKTCGAEICVHAEMKIDGEKVSLKRNPSRYYALLRWNTRAVLPKEPDNDTL